MRRCVESGSEGLLSCDLMCESGNAACLDHPGDMSVDDGP